MNRADLVRLNKELEIQRALGISINYYHVWVHYSVDKEGNEVPLGLRRHSEDEVVLALSNEHAELLALDIARRFYGDSIRFSGVTASVDKSYPKPCPDRGHRPLSPIGYKRPRFWRSNGD